MNDLDRKRKEVELIRVNAAKSEMELQIYEKLSEIERIKKNIEIQESRVAELEKLLKQ